MRAAGNTITTLAIVLAMFALFFITLGPSQYVGPVTYVITRGISMEPVFVQGDLVLLRTSTSYTVGDIVGFRTPDISLVVHRIIGMEGDRFVTQGDNNSVEDRYRPELADMVGELWLHFPGLGDQLAELDARLVLGFAVTIVTALILLELNSLSKSTRRRRRRRDDFESGNESFIL